MEIFLLAGLILIAFSFVLMVRTAAFSRTRQRATLAQIGSYGFRSATHAVERTRSFRDVVHALADAAGARAVARLGSERERQVRSDLDAAGLYRTAAARFVGYRVLAAVAAGAFVALVSLGDGKIGAGGIFLVVWLGALGWFMPSFLLKRRARLRLERVDREVPELVDLLVTTVEAGVAFAAGIQLAARSVQGPLGDELRLVLREQSLGLTPDEALRNLAVRVDTPALRAFTQALIQGESLGVSIGKIMRELAVDMRKRRKQMAEERAQKTPTKILFPLVGLILPAMFILALGPMLIRVKDFFDSV